jgi:hypothetical protein
VSLDINALQEEQKQLKDQGGTNNFLENFVRMPEGKGSVTVRLLPPAPAGMFGRKKNPFYQWTRIHRVNNKSLHDPREFVNGRWIGQNPIGDYLKWLWKESEKKSPEEQDKMRALYREIKPIPRYYYNCIVRREESEDGTVHENVGPKILSIGKTLHQLILAAICGDEELGMEPLGDVTDLKNGRDFKIFKNIVKSGNSSFPKYDASRFLDPSPLGTPEECETWMANIHDLSSLRVLKSPEELNHELKIHLGVIADNSTDFDPSEYQKSDDQMVVTTESEAKVESNTTNDYDTETETNDPVEDEEEEVLADDDFLKELKAMGG